MQQSGHHFQPHAQKRQETNFHPNISEGQFKSVSSHKCLTNSKLNLSAHTNFSLSSKGRESHSHLASQKCLTKLHAAKRQSLSTSRSKGTGHKFPSKFQNANSKASAHTNVSRIPSLNLSAHTNVSLSSKGGKAIPTSFHTNVSLSSMQKSGHHFQPHDQKAQETNFHLNL